MLILLSISGTEPVTLADAKVAARVDNDLGDTSSLDDVITGAITTAREQAEQLTGRVYRAKVLRAQFSDWPAADDVIHVYAPNAVSISYWDGSAWQELVVPDFAFFPCGIDGTGTGIAPALNTSWPTLGAIAGGPRVRVDLTAGPTGDPGELPIAECVKTYIKAQVTGWVNNGEALVNQQLQANPMLAGLLDSEDLLC